MSETWSFSILLQDEGSQDQMKVGSNHAGVCKITNNSFLSKAPTVTVKLKNKNKILGETDALLDNGADITIGSQ